MPARAGAIASWIAWAAWATFIGLYTLALLPYFQHGLNELSSEVIRYRNSPGSQYVPGPSMVYGSRDSADTAFSFVCAAPCLSFFVPIAIFWQIIYHWYEDSRNRRRAKTVALVLSVLLLGFSTYMGFRYLDWLDID